MSLIYRSGGGGSGER